LFARHRHSMSGSRAGLAVSCPLAGNNWRFGASGERSTIWFTTVGLPGYME
jgi:hypothetical protein